MNRNRVIVLGALLASTTAALVVACSDSESTAPGSSTGVDSGTSSTKDGSSSSSSGSSGDPVTDSSTPKPDAGGDGGDCTGQFDAPVLLGPGPCGTSPFGEPATTFVAVDPDGGVGYSGTTLAPGIYDAVKAERLSANGGSWRETFVVSGNRFTRIRQVDTGTGSGPGPISYRSGTFVYAGQFIQLTYDCAQLNDAGVDAGFDELPSDAITTADCNAQYRYGASGIRVTLRRR